MFSDSPDHLENCCRRQGGRARWGSPSVWKFIATFWVAEKFYFHTQRRFRFRISLLGTLSKSPQPKCFMAVSRMVMSVVSAFVTNRFLAILLLSVRETSKVGFAIRQSVIAMGKKNLRSRFQLLCLGDLADSIEKIQLNV